MTTKMADRASLMGMTGMPAPAMGPGMSMGAPAGMPAATGMMMVPRCNVTMAKCAGGMTIHCASDDATTAGMIQGLCAMLAGGACCCCMTMNGMTACCCNMIMAHCKCETTEDGVKITCTSGDKACAEMIQACCDCMTAMMKAGCCCVVCLGNTPVCCSC